MSLSPTVLSLVAAAVAVAIAGVEDRGGVMSSATRFCPAGQGGVRDAAKSVYRGGWRARAREPGEKKRTNELGIAKKRGAERARQPELRRRRGAQREKRELVFASTERSLCRGMETWL